MAQAAQQAETLQVALEQLVTAAGPDLHSLLLYGSAVRGNLEATSDINVLLVLKQIIPDILARVGEVLRVSPRISPLILGKSDLPGTLHSFAPKFLSIRRDYRVVAGEDVLAGFHVDPDLDLFLTAQGLRNLRLRLARSYAMLAHEPQRFSKYLLRVLPSLFVSLSEALRLSHVPMAHAFEDRVPLLTAHLGAGAGVLGELLELRHSNSGLDAAAAASAYERCDGLLGAALQLLERK